MLSSSATATIGGISRMMLPLRLRRVAGHEGRLNDALFQPAARAPPLGSQTIVYFGGDVQDYPEVMQLHREHRHYVKWNLENTARMLGHNFPTKHVLVVKCARVEYKSFSCYDNFVPGNNAGIPEHTPTHNALHHLEKLLQAVTTRLKELPTAELLEAVTSASLPEEIDIEDLHKSTVQTSGAGSEQGEASGTSPKQGEASGTSPKQGEASRSSGQGEASGASPGQGETKGASPRQGEASGASPKQGEASGASPKQGVASGASPKQGEASGASPKPGEASGASPKQGKASGASPKQGKASGASLGLNEASPPGQPEPEADPLWWRDKLALDESQLTLVGFSKGCVVLNQLIYEFHYTKTLTPGDAHMLKFMERIADMYWLDGGHAGGKNTWITSRSLLETLTRLNVNIFIHVSPYQVRDDGRPWIGREEKAFTRLLKKLGAKVNRYMHNKPGMSHTLNMHFEVLGGFKRLQDSLPVSMPDSSDEEQ